MPRVRRDLVVETTLEILTTLRSLLTEREAEEATDPSSNVALSRYRRVENG